MENEALKKWKTWAIISTCLLVLVSTLYGLGVGWKNQESVPEVPEQNEAEEEISFLQLWNDDAKAKQELEAYIKAVTDENSADFIPVKDRIAVFDLDGTLFCETDPVYFDYQLLLRRVLEDPDYKDQATDFERETAAKVLDQIETGSGAKGLEVDHGKCIASSFKGMTIRQFNDYIQKFKNEPAPGYNNMNRGDAFYLPMVEILVFQDVGARAEIHGRAHHVIGIADAYHVVVRDIGTGQRIDAQRRTMLRRAGRQQEDSHHKACKEFLHNRCHLY